MKLVESEPIMYQSLDTGPLKDFSQQWMAQVLKKQDELIIKAVGVPEELLANAMTRRHNPNQT